MYNQQLRAALQDKRWSIEVASARVGVSRVTFSRWLNGHQQPQPGQLAALCEVFGCAADALGYDHLSKEPPPRPDLDLERPYVLSVLGRPHRPAAAPRLHRGSCRRRIVALRPLAPSEAGRRA